MSNAKKRLARKIWLVKHPIGQYIEDVKQLALSNSLKIVDAKFAELFPESMIATKTPALNSTNIDPEQAAKLARDAEIEAERAEIERKTRLEIEVRAEVMKEYEAKPAKK